MEFEYTILHKWCKIELIEFAKLICGYLTTECTKSTAKNCKKDVKGASIYFIKKSLSYLK